MSGFLKELQSVDPIVEVEDDALMLRDMLSVPSDEDLTSQWAFMAHKMPKVLETMTSLVAAKKVEYDVGDEEVGYVPGLEEARKEAEKYKSIITMLLDQRDAKDQRPRAVPFDLDSFEKSFFKFTKQSTRATSVIDGKKAVTTSEGDLKLVFSELMTKLEGSQFHTLYGLTQDTLDHLHEIVKDPDTLDKTIEMYTTVSELELNRYKIRAEKKTGLANALRDS